MTEHRFQNKILKLVNLHILIGDYVGVHPCDERRDSHLVVFPVKPKVFINKYRWAPSHFLCVSEGLNPCGKESLQFAASER